LVDKGCRTRNGRALCGSRWRVCGPFETRAERWTERDGRRRAGLARTSARDFRRIGIAQWLDSISQWEPTAQCWDLFRIENQRHNSRERHRRLFCWGDRPGLPRQRGPVGFDGFPPGGRLRLRKRTPPRLSPPPLYSRVSEPPTQASSAPCSLPRRAGIDPRIPNSEVKLGFPSKTCIARGAVSSQGSSLPRFIRITHRHRFIITITLA
jgi:hypothetical protein